MRYFTIGLAATAALFFLVTIPCCSDNDDDEKSADIFTDDDSALSDEPTLVDDPFSYVNPFIGTGGMWWSQGQSAPGPQLPNGMVKLSPDTGLGNFSMAFMHCGGYWYLDTHIRTFSHTHLPGTGIGDLGNFGLMPVDGMTDETVGDMGHLSAFSHKSETAYPGYYRVTLDRGNIDAELTATMNAGVHRYTYPEGADPYIVIDVSRSISWYASRAAEVTVDLGSQEVYGWTDQHGGFSGIYGGTMIYFVARFSEPIADYGTFTDHVREPQSTFAEGRSIGAYLGFGDVPEVEAAVGISFIDLDHARANLEAQVAGKSFENVLAEAQIAWASKLDDFKVWGGSEKERFNFFSAVYRLYVLPTNFTEEGGEYMGFDRRPHDSKGITYYSDFSLWDTFRGFHPLMVLLRPDMNGDFIESMIRMYEQGGSFPMWAQATGETDVMIGTHADTVIADAVLKGNDDFNLEETYWGLREHAVGPVEPAGRPGIEDWINLGYVAYNHESQSVSRTLEYALNDYCLAQYADKLGYEEDYEMFLARSKNYVNLWDPETLYFRPKKSNGDWVPMTGLYALNQGYTEGNKEHWRWFVPQDAAGLMDLMGGRGPFIEALSAFFENAVGLPNLPTSDPYYWHGNEPDEHAAYFFSLAGRPDLTAKWIRWIMAEKYDNTPSGLDGNDDGGTMSAWYIFSALGFFPFPCTDIYAIGTPLFPKAVMNVGFNKLTVIAENVSVSNMYVKSVTLDGTPIEVPWLTHDQIAQGGTLTFVMDSKPSNWGQGAIYR